MKKTIGLLLLFAPLCFAASTHDILADHIDSSVSPAQDFSQYANGAWLKKNPIPPSERSWGINRLVMDETYDRMRALSEAAGESKPAPGTNAQKIGDFYYSGMDEATIASQGASRLQPELERIAAIRNGADLVEEVARLQELGVDTLFSVDVHQDEKDSARYAVHLTQGGLVLPDRDYYLNDDDRTKNVRTEYLKHLSTMFQLLGEDAATAARDSQVVLSLETQLAKASRKLEDLRDPEANYNKMATTDFVKKYPKVDWNSLLKKLDMSAETTVIVGQPEFYETMDVLVATTALADLKTYMRHLLVDTYAPYMAPAFDDAHFAFFGTVLTGQKEQRPRWKRVLDAQEGFLGDALGQLYVEKYYSPATKKRYEQLTENILAAYKERIEHVTWLSDKTRANALGKLAKVRRKVGYPTKWKDYSSMTIARASYVENAMQGNEWLYQFAVSKLGHPVDRDEWTMTPQTYNAYYEPSNNEIVLPAAAFIIPGIADDKADDAIIYGYAGASTIGHEITHGFDDRGRQFDADGNLSSWWTQEDIDAFNKATQLYVDQFNSYVVLGNMHVNGKATLGENIADLGGVVNALEAFKKTEQYRKGEKIAGFTPLQRFFLGYALGWMIQQRDESLQQQILSDVHAPPSLRINGPLANVPEFYEAFGVKPGDAMYRAENIRVKIW